MERRRWRQGTRWAAFAAVFSAFALVPAGMAFAQDPVGDLLKGVSNIAGGGTGDGGGVTSQQIEPEPPEYQPPLHGDNPHGQGTVVTGDITPSTDRPLSGDTDGGDGTQQEEIVVGRARGEQNDDGSYHGHVTILALFGTELFGVDSQPGESNSSPFDPLQTGLFDPLCEQSTICIQLLVADSETTDDGSTNHFNLVDAQAGDGEQSVQANIAESNGNISDDGTCQTAHGDSEAASINAGGSGVLAVGQSESTSTDCNDGSAPTTNQDSSFITLGETELPLLTAECAEGEPDAGFFPLFPIISAVCNADDTNGIGEAVVQADEPYGVREAFSLFVLSLLEGQPVLKGTVAAAESHAVAPPDSTSSTPPTTPSTPATTDGGGNGGNGGGGDNGAGGSDGGEGAGPAAGAVQAGDDDLAFTGADMLVLGLIGAALILGGLGLARASGRHRRATA